MFSAWYVPFLIASVYPLKREKNYVNHWSFVIDELEQVRKLKRPETWHISYKWFKVFLKNISLNYIY